jgi:hypothetical protein
MEREMKADALLKSCLLACSVLTGSQALADPIISTQSPYTVNSIHFSYMNYSQPPASYFNRRPPPFRGLPPPLPADPPAGAPGPALPPAQTGQTGTLPPIEPPVQSPVVVVPEPGTVALMVLGLILLARAVKKADAAK